MNLLVKVFLGLSILPILSVYGERGLWTFDTDPGLITSNGGGTDQNFKWFISNGSLNLTMTRESAAQRVYIPLGSTYGNSSTFRLRTRFRILNNQSASIFYGFFDRNDTTNISNGGDHVNLEYYSNINHPSGYGAGHYDHGNLTISNNTWYILEMSFRAYDSTYIQSIYSNAGTLLARINPSTAGLNHGVNAIGFCNYNESQNSTYETVQFDWVNWSVDETLLPNPVQPIAQIKDVYARTGNNFVDITTDIESLCPKDKNVIIRSTAYADQIIDAGHVLFQNDSNALNLPAYGVINYQKSINGITPNLWRPEDPHTYLIRIQVLDADDINTTADTNDKIIRFQQFSRPSLFFNQSELPIFQQRALYEPYLSVYNEFKHIIDDTPGIGSYGNMQLNALLYIITQDRKYASNAKSLLMNELKFWETYIPSGDGTDNRQSLEISRLTQGLCMVYDNIQPAGIFTIAEEEYARTILKLAASRLMERGNTYNPCDYYSTCLRTSNWDSDRFIAVGMFALAFPDDPCSQGWLEHAIEEMNWQLDNVLLPDGLWPEGTRYHGAVLRAFIPFAFALKNNGDMDFFENSKFQSMFECLLHIQSPRDIILGSTALTPGVKDADWENVWETALAWGAAGIAEYNSMLAGNIMWAWQRAGSPFTMEMTPGNPMCGYLFIDANIPSIARNNVYSEVLPNGFAVLRNQFNTDEEFYLLYNYATESGIGHDHFDSGNISLYAYNTPLILDPGCSHYDTSQTEWYIRSKAHNVVLFNDADNSGNGIITDYIFDNILDYIGSDMTAATGAGYNRHIFFIKPSYFLVWDDINSLKTAQYQLHVITDNNTEPSYDSLGNPPMECLTFSCQNNINLDVDIISPVHAVENNLLNIINDPYTINFWAEQNYLPTEIYSKLPKWVQLDQSTVGEDFLTLFYPKNTMSSTLDLLNFDKGLTQISPHEQITENFNIDPNWSAHKNGQNYFYWSYANGGVLDCQLTRDGINHRRYVKLGRTYTQDDSFSLSFDFRFSKMDYVSAYVGLFNSNQPDNQSDNFFTELYAATGWAYIWCSGSFKRNDSPNAFVNNVPYHATLAYDPVSATATLTIINMSTGLTLEVVNYNCSGKSFEVDSLGVGNVSIVPNSSIGQVKLDNFTFASQAKESEFMTASVSVGTNIANFYLNSQNHTDPNEEFIGKTAIQITNTQNSQENLYIVRGSLFNLGQDYKISVDRDTTLSHCSLVPGKSWVLKNFGPGTGQHLQLKAPWSTSLTNVHVFTLSGDEISIIRNEELSAIDITMDQSNYVIVCGFLDFIDFADFAMHWQDRGISIYDFNGDYVVDWSDLSVFVEFMLQVN